MIREVCSCGAELTVNTGRPISEEETARKWRSEHRHSEPGRRCEAVEVWTQDYSYEMVQPLTPAEAAERDGMTEAELRRKWTSEWPLRCNLPEGHGAVHRSLLPGSREGEFVWQN